MRHTFPLIAAFLAGTLLAAETKKTWDFEQDEPGKIAKGFNSEVGQWEVAVDSGNHVLYQKARNDDATFNVALAEGTSYKDLDLSVQAPGRRRRGRPRRRRGVAGEGQEELLHLPL